MISKTAYRSTLVAGVLSTIGATACCVLPLALVTLGFSGAWLAMVHSLESLQPLFAALAVACLGFAFHALYIQPRSCAPGESCALPRVLKRQRIVFWLVVTGIMGLSISYTYIAFME